MDEALPRWKTLLDRSTALSFRADPQAVDLAHEALQLAEDGFGEGSGEVLTCLRALGMAYHGLQDWGRAIRFLGSAVRAAGASEDGDQAHAIAQLAYAHAMRGNNSEALELAERACAMAERTGPLAMHAKTVGNLATISSVLRDDVRAVEACQRAERLLQKARSTVPDPLEVDVDLGVTAITRAQACSRLGDKAQAEEALSSAVGYLEAQRGNGLKPAAPHLEVIEVLLEEVFLGRRSSSEYQAMVERLAPLR